MTPIIALVTLVNNVPQPVPQPNQSFEYRRKNAGAFHASQLCVSFDIIRMNKPIKLDVFGKLVLAIHTNDGWEMFYLSKDGKRRLATDIYVPNFVNEAEIENYIEDICHEWATEKHPNVRRLN